MASDDDDELRLPVDLAPPGRDDDVVLGSAERARELGEEDRLFGEGRVRLLGMGSEVPGRSEDLLRPRHWRP